MWLKYQSRKHPGGPPIREASPCGNPVWIECPGTPREGAPWDEFWRAFLAHPVTPSSRLVSTESRMYQSDLNLWSDLEAKTVLFPGNGICTLPYGYQHRGLQVIALDISPVATEYCRAHPPEEWQLLNLFCFPYSPTPLSSSEDMTPRREHARRAMARAARPGGSLTFVVSHVLEYDPGEGTLDGIVAMQFLDLFSDDEQRMLAACFYRWLSPGGVVIVDGSLNWGERRKEGTRLVSHFEAVGFLVHPYMGISGNVRSGQSWWQRLIGRRDSSAAPPARPVGLGELGEGVDARFPNWPSPREASAAEIAEVRTGRKLVIMR